MAYRDEHVKCPHCGTDLTDAVVGLACTTCRGMWIAPASLWEMTVNMQTPPALIDLPVLENEIANKLASRAPLGCPECRTEMHLRWLYNVPIDICEKHGIWLDPNELAMVLARSIGAPPRK